MWSTLFSLEGLSSSHHSSLRRSSWRKDLNVLMVRRESSLRQISLLSDPFTSLSKRTAAGPCPSARMLTSSLRCLVLVPSLPPSQTLCILPTRAQETLRLLLHGIYRVKNIVTTCTTPSILFFFFFFLLTFCLSFMWGRFLGQSAAGTIGSVTGCSVTVLWCLIGRLLKILAN